MNKLTLIFAALFLQAIAFAQQKKEIVTPVKSIEKPAAMVATKVLKKQLELNFKRKKYKAVIVIADTLLTRIKKDDNIFIKKMSSQIYLKMDKDAISTIKMWFKNKDTAATLISSIPSQYDFVTKKRSGDIYYKAAMAYAPKNGIPYILYGAQLADIGKNTEALNYARKGYNLTTGRYKIAFASTFALVLNLAGQKEEAYKLMENELANGRNTSENIRDYFNLYIQDKKYEEGIKKATEYINKDSMGMYFVERAEMQVASGSMEKACEDATILKEKYNEGDYFLKKYNCTQVMADVSPSFNRTYIYEVEFFGKLYDFRVSNPLVDMQKGISFKYKLTGDVGYNGTVNISEEAINKAHTQMNHFGKEELSLTDKTTVWLSNEVFSEIKTKGETYIDGDAYQVPKSVTFTDVTDALNIDELYYTVKVDDQNKYIKCIKVLGKDGEEMWINDDPKNPLILKMKTDFRIELKQIL